VALVHNHFTDFDIILDILFMKDSTHNQKITKQMLKEFLISDIKLEEVTDRDVDMLIRTHP
jgi:hypothetical protein